MPDRLPPQITEVQEGDELQFIRNCTDGFVHYAKTRKVCVIEADGNTALIACHLPLRNMFGQVDRSRTFEHGGFEMCRWIETHKLISNCRRVGGKA